MTSTEPTDLRPGAEAWDERYASADRMWSGQPNGALVAEVAGLAPGRVLDVGCGEGADAVWLAQQGWDVTALDVSGVALERAAGHAADAGVQVRWVHAGLVEARLAAGSFDLVSAQYPVLVVEPAGVSQRALEDVVAPGGVLLFVHHDLAGHTHAQDNGFDPADFLSPADVEAALGDDWHVEVDERRERHLETGAGAGHVHDLVLRARRLR